MEAGRKDCEEETLQTAFKKLRVDAESVTGAASAADVLVPRVTPRPGSDSGGAKPKLSCPKDNWHGCMRKSSRGASRSQRRRRSKSPILHPSKFSYCSPASVASALSSSGLKRLAVPEAAEPRPLVDGGPAPSVALPVQKELLPSAIFGSCAGYESRVAAVGSSPSLELPGAAGRDGDLSVKDGVPEKSACDFGDLSKLHGSLDVPPCAACSCAPTNRRDAVEESGRGAEGPCACQAHSQSWSGVEVYSFTGLRNAISECGRSLPGHASRTLAAGPNAASSPSGSPRSCSEQARAYVDDITIEDLSGYMEYYLYIPKKMSHMAEMMYT